MKALHIHKISDELGVQAIQIKNTVQLLDQGASVPFIARYRKELTGSLDEVQITQVRDRYKQLNDIDLRREKIIESLEEQQMLTEDLREKLEASETLHELEDIYLPYRPRRKTRASIARERGLEPLAKIIMKQQENDITHRAAEYVDAEKSVENADQAVEGAMDIIAEWMAEDITIRNRMRNLFRKKAFLSCKVIVGKEAEGEKYEQYFDFHELLDKLPSHRLLAILRAENENIVRVSVGPEESLALDIMRKRFLKAASPCAHLLEEVIKDSYKRLLRPSMETEMRQWAKEKADVKAIGVFAENLRQLLLASPLGQKNILALDPGFKTGCKLVCLDKQGNLLHNETIYPHPPQSERRQANRKILSLVNAYNIEAIAIGNGTAGRETEDFIRRIPFDRDVLAIMVNESGASVYSASALAREEFPDYDVTVRGAVSIGRRLMDPLAELVKIDPKSIGVGQYQHDVDQGSLKKSLEDVVISCVNSVGVDVNTASRELLTYVSGLGPGLAKNIVDYRKENGEFLSREELKKVARFGPKAFELAAGFLRVAHSSNPLDKSAVHPESYHIVSKMASSLNTDINELMNKAALRSNIRIEDFVSEKTGIPTLKDIMKELEKPGRDPREKFDFFEFDKNVHNMDDLQEGMVLPGIITNITAFGAFVDIGVHINGLIHISQLADHFVKDPNDVVKINQKLEVRVVSVDNERKRIQLSRKGLK